MSQFIRVKEKKTGNEMLVAKDKIRYVDQVSNGKVFINFNEEEYIEVDQDLATMEKLLNG